MNTGNVDACRPSTADNGNPDESARYRDAERTGSAALKTCSVFVRDSGVSVKRPHMTGILQEAQWRFPVLR
jgi:hypothetical protein